MIRTLDKIAWASPDFPYKGSAGEHLSFKTWNGDE